MRIRSIKPEFWSHEKMSAIPAEAALLAIGLLNYCDDEGFFNANPKLVHAALTPLREMSMTIPVIISELSRIGYVEVRTDGEGRATGRVVNFDDHQVISHPKKSVLRPLFEASINGHGTLPDASGKSLSGMEGNGREQGTGKGTGNARVRGKPKAAGINPGDQPEPLRSRLLTIGALLRRQTDTIWTAEELEAFKTSRLDELTDPDFDGQVAPLAVYYGAAIPRENDYRRRDVLRLLRNWPGELDRARAWVRDHDDGVKKM